MPAVGTGNGHTLAALAGLLASAAVASEPAGPPAPADETEGPAGRAMTRYREISGRQIVARSCRPNADDEITICARRPGERSPYRLPLPDERGPPDGPRRATGEIPRAGLDASPGPAPEPSRLLGTIVKLVKAAKGEDPD